MPTATEPRRQDRVFVRDGRRHHRKSYSRAEFRIGLTVLAGLAGLLVWVAWKGAHPDPELLSAEVDLLATGEGAIVPIDGAPPPGRTVGTPVKPVIDRGALPANLAADGWIEGPVSHFDWENLYVKINGREGYYKSRGFELLTFVSLESSGDPASIDVELYDLGAAANAIGAYTGEKPPEIAPVVTEAGLSHLDRNALLMTRGRYYVRMVGSDESPAVQRQLERLRERFGTLPAEPLPWAFRLFTGSLGLDPGRLTYFKENAFSFGFARDVYAAVLDDGETEIFVTGAIAGEGAGDVTELATALAGRFVEGFRQYGEAAGESAGVSWTRDRFLGTIAGAAPVGPWVVGVRGAADLAAAEKALGELREGVGALPAPETGTGAALGGESETGDGAAGGSSAGKDYGEGY